MGQQIECQSMDGLAMSKTAPASEKGTVAIGLRTADRVMDVPCRCPNCGSVVDPMETSSFKRGAVSITGDPRLVLWNGRPVGLSPTQAEIFATIAIRGRASFDAIDEAMTRFGASPKTRSIHILRIRQKFAAVGARDPFERVGSAGFRLQIEADASNATGTVIGMRSRP